jgi:hypothetical protein
MGDVAVVLACAIHEFDFLVQMGRAIEGRVCQIVTVKPFLVEVNNYHLGCTVGK